MDARALLAKLRHNVPLTDEDARWTAQAIAEGTLSDAQSGAFAMGVCRNGLTPAARVALTLAMRDTGDVLAWDLNGPVLDKHSTGGVGDCVSLVLAPALAACGAYVPMISGRGLGHTGGTLDKLEAIGGVQTQIDTDRLRRIVARTGCAIVGASAQIAPADQRLYAIRDVTSTVDSIDLITASILSKKLAAGLDGLVLDVKIGSGAFMKDIGAAQELAEALTQTANDAGCPTSAFISDMNQPLVPSLGNAVEVAEVMRVLTGDGAGPLVDLAAALGGALLCQGNLANDPHEGALKIRTTISSGAAAERFEQMISALGGPRNFATTWRNILPEAPVICAVPAPCSGIVSAIDGQALGLAVVDLGGGRRIETDLIDPSVGITQVARLGQHVMRGDTIATVHAARIDAAERAVHAVQQAITITDAAAGAALYPLIHQRIS